MKFLIDMNLSPLWVTFLAERGYEAAGAWSIKSTISGSA